MASIVQRWSEGICRRAFSSPEAALYELAIAPAVCQAVEPLLATALSASLDGWPLLDVGCGSGRLAKALCKSSPRGVVGIDPSWSQVRRAASVPLALRRVAYSGTGRLGGKAMPRAQMGAMAGAMPAARARAEQLPFRSGAFGFVYSCCTWKHWRDPALGISECARVTRPGGRLVVVEVDGSSTRDEFGTFAETTRIPTALRGAYVNFAMRTVVSVAPTPRQLAASLAQFSVHELSIEQIPGLPFLVAAAKIVR